MKNIAVSISDMIFKGFFRLISATILMIPLLICGLIPFLGWLAIPKIVIKFHSIEDSLFSKYKKSKFRSKLSRVD